MYYKKAISIPLGTKKIVFLKSGNNTYVYYETDRVYNNEKKYNSPVRTIIGKRCNDDISKMFPNERFYDLFPESSLKDDEKDYERSFAIKIGSYIVIKKIIQELKLEEVLLNRFNSKDTNIILDLSAYGIVCEDNANQYYPSYAYEHALFTENMKVYSDSTISRWLNSIETSDIINTISIWNSKRNHNDDVYISYDSTNKNSNAKDVELVEYGEAKVKTGSPIINISMAYDVSERLPAFYEEYPGSIPDVSQLSSMIEKAIAYGYRNIGFIIDRGYFSKENIDYLDDEGFAFIIMIKGQKSIINKLIEQRLHTFEKKSSCYIEQFELFGTTVEAPLFKNDDKIRYIHIYHSSSKEAIELLQFNEQLKLMKKNMNKMLNKNTSIPKEYEEYFTPVYLETEEDKIIKIDGERKKIRVKNKIFDSYIEKEEVVERHRNLCGYFAIASSKKMSALEAISIYKSRDASEKLFRGDKSYLGDKSLRLHSSESVETKIFVEFIALIIRTRIYTKLFDLNMNLTSKLNYLTVPAAIKELEKIIVIKLPDGKYHKSYALTKTQKTILSAFSITEEDILKETLIIEDTLYKAEYQSNNKTKNNQ